MAEKTCRRCKDTLNVSQFGKRATSKDGLSSYCKPCLHLFHQEWRARNPDKVRETNKRWRQANRDSVLMYQLRHRLKSFGMTIEDYEKLIVKQKGCCALCGLRTRALVIDHCHDSGRVRGLLCKNCNVALGHFKDEPAVLRKAIKYLS